MFVVVFAVHTRIGGPVLRPWVRWWLDDRSLDDTRHDRRIEMQVGNTIVSFSRETCVSMQQTIFLAALVDRNSKYLEVPQCVYQGVFQEESVSLNYWIGQCSIAYRVDVNERSLDHCPHG